MEKTNLEKQIEAVIKNELNKEALVRAVYDAAENTKGEFQDSSEMLNFIALAKFLGISTNRKIAASLRKAYVDGAIMNPHWGLNINIGLLEFVEGMKELGVGGDELADYLAETLEYRVVEGINFEACLECVTIPFAKSGYAKTKIKEKLRRLQREPMFVQQNKDSIYSTWEEKAKDIGELFRTHESALYKLGQVYDDIARFHVLLIDGWRQKATIRMYHRDEKMDLERLSDKGDEGKYKQLLIEERALLEDIPQKAGRNRAVELAWLDIALESIHPRSISIIGATSIYRKMLRVAEAIAPEKKRGIEETAKNRYGQL